MVKHPQAFQMEPQNNLVQATCGLCAGIYQLDVKGDYREGALCPHCGSSGRSQSIAYALTHYVFKQDVALCHVKRQEYLKLVGLSDGPAYSKILAKKCEYTNTYRGVFNIDGSIY